MRRPSGTIADADSYKRGAVREAALTLLDNAGRAHSTVDRIEADPKA